MHAELRDSCSKPNSPASAADTRESPLQASSCTALHAQVEVCCFDKTGTLTSDHLLLEEVVAPESDTKKASAHLVMATCHSLIQVCMRTVIDHQKLYF